MGKRSSWKLMIVWVWSLSVLHAQNNIHYSQFYNAPMFLNPALTGQIGEDLFRLNGHARNQWAGLTNGDQNLYENKSGGVDLSLFKKKLGVGVYILKDDAGGGIFSSIMIMPSLSYSFIMGDNTLTFGAQPLINISQFDINKVGPPGPPGSFPTVGQDFNPSSTYIDANVGVNFKWDLYYLTANLGLSVTNLIEAPQRFLKNGGGIMGLKVPRTYKTYALLDFDIMERMKLLPGFYGSFQAVSTNFLMGSNFSYKLLKGGTYGNSLILGLWLRTNDGNLESAIPTFGMKMNKLQVMMSYDAHLSFSKGGNSKYLDGIANSLEISIIFTGKPKVSPPLLEDGFILNPRY